jgi:hypothetical protein
MFEKIVIMVSSTPLLSRFKRAGVFRIYVYMFFFALDGAAFILFVDFHTLKNQTLCDVTIRVSSLRTKLRKEF